MSEVRETLPSVAIELSIPFHDIDPLAVAWHGHYAKYLELARCALLESFDYSYEQMAQSGYAWPVIDLHVRYIQAIRFRQNVRVVATLEEWEYRMKIAYQILDAASGARLAKASTVQVAVTMPGFEMQLASPDILARKLGLK
ncbi:MAG TPA: acyl-CoA thioesterase [Candidatus Binatia bacterium]|nr:acyl-CoA thioesterase [Candidatus Binatia bacterium]